MAGGLPTSPSIEAYLLDVLTYEDDQWLWEVVWHLNAEFPEESLTAKVRLARQTVLAMQRDGRIVLWRGEWPSGAVEPLTPEAVVQLLTDNLPWFNPQHASCLVVIGLA